MAGYLPFDEPNLASLYMRIHKADFSFPSWFSSCAKKLIKRILDPNPLTVHDIHNAHTCKITPATFCSSKEVVLFMLGRWEEDGIPNMSINLLTVAGTGNTAFLNELRKVGLDPNVGDCNGRTPLHISASKGHEECAVVLLKHVCSLHLRARRNDLVVMKELIKHGLFVDSKNHHGLNAIQVATIKNHVDMVKFLLMNGSEVNETVKNKILSINLDEMLQKREVGHRIVIPDPLEDVFGRNKNELQCTEESAKSIVFDKTSIYRGYPANRRENNYTEPGKLIRIRLPHSLTELKKIAARLNLMRKGAHEYASKCTSEARKIAEEVEMEAHKLSILEKEAS